MWTPLGLHNMSISVGVLIIYMCIIYVATVGSFVERTTDKCSIVGVSKYGRFYGCHIKFHITVVFYSSLHFIANYQQKPPLKVLC